MLIESKALIPHPLEYRLLLLVIKRHRDQRARTRLLCSVVPV